MVRLITHNVLACHAKNCQTNNFPLAFSNVRIELKEADFNSDFLRGFLPKLEWTALVDTAKQARRIYTFLLRISCLIASFPLLQLGDTSLPQERPEMLDDDFLQRLHHVLFEVPDCHVI
jgi:multifunctional methyltransferase subunit TRM112